jgi:hypothetical protein
MQNFESTELETRQANDPLAQAIMSLVDVMRADFGERFTRTFVDDIQLRQLKRRLYRMLDGFVFEDITAGYETLVKHSPHFVPSVPEIAEAVKSKAIERKRAESENAKTTLPPPVYAELVDAQEAIGNAVKNLKTHPDNEQDRVKRLSEALASHEALIAQHANSGKIRQPEVAFYECEFSGCQKPGSISHGTKGGGKFYCWEHFQRTA